MFKTDQRVLDWLLEPNQPAVRYRTMIDLLDISEKDSDVKRTYENISKRGWAFDILREQKKKGYWESEKSLYQPKYTATNWRAIVLSDLGLDTTNQKIRNTAGLIFKYWLSLPSGENIFNEEVCVVGNTARTLTRFGYEDDFRVRKLFDRLVEDQKGDGGWHCFQSTHGTLDGWEGMAAFAALPKAKRTRGIKNAIERGAEFYLNRKLFKEGARYAPWFKFHYPVHYYYDILVGLDMITALGFGGDKRLNSGLEILKEKRLQNGTWKLDAVHPDLGRGAGYRFTSKPHIFALEKVGKPSKWVTFTALRVLKRVDEST